jgi:hypothetical protein
MEEPAEVPVAARVMGLVVTMVVLTVISNLFSTAPVYEPPSTRDTNCESRSKNIED